MLVPRIVVPVDATVGVIESPAEFSLRGAKGAGASTLVPRILVPLDAIAGVIESPTQLSLRGAKGAGASTLVPRILVPLDAIAGVIESPRELPENARAWPAITRPAVFVQAMLENSPTKPKGWATNVVVSLTVHGIALAALFFVPLYFPEAIDLHEFNPILLAEPPALAPPPPPIPVPAPATRPRATPKKALRVAAKLGVPWLIPSQIARPGAQPGGTDLPPEVAGGVPGGVPGGQLGGVVGGILTGGSATAGYIPPPPTSPAPRSPIRVGGDVKEPRLIYQILPIYPPLLRQAKVSGDVVIKLVIDTRGNVVEMHPVSGDQQLVSAAMDAVRQWKYEPTVLGGQAVSVELTVTIQFRPT